jgi:hypothetical protein
MILSTFIGWDDFTDFSHFLREEINGHLFSKVEAEKLLE